MKFRDLGFKQRFILLGVTAVVGFAAVLIIVAGIIDRVMVNGEIYNDVIQDKDLIADVLPPTLYLVEPFLLCHRIAAEENENARDEMILALEEGAKQFERRRQYLLTNLRDGALKQALLEKADDSVSPAVELIRLIREEFLPSARAGEMASRTAEEILIDDLEPIFRKHRAHVLKIVERVNESIREGEASAAQAVESGSRTALIVSVVVIGVILAFGAFIVSTVLRPMNLLRSRMLELASGDADLGARIEIDSDDEVGQLARSFNAFVGKIAALVNAVRKSSVQLTSASTEMAATSREQEGTINSFGSSTNQIAASVQQISATGAELLKTIEEITGIAHESARLATTGRGNLETMDDTMQQLQASSGSISGKLSVINERAGDITSVVTTITKVADQTNLLSVNAAIEAEKAGEYGRGFLVVAQEIRRLADQTASATLEIEDSVQEMQTSVSAGVMEMDKFADHVRRSVRVVTEVAAQLGQIISQVEGLTGRFDTVGEGMRSQAQGADQIHDAMSSLNETVQLTVSALAEVTSVAEELRNAASVLNGEIGKFRFED